jgi:hypothetical protein
MKRFFEYALYAFLIAELSFTPSLAGSTGASPPPGVLQKGTVTANDCVSWVGANQIQDAGSACGSGSAGVSSLTGDSVLYSNSASTGAVTLTPVAATAKSLFGNVGASSAAPGFVTSPVVSGSYTGASFIPTGASAPSNGLYLKAANDDGIAAQSLLVADFIGVAAAVNNFTFTNGATGVAPVISFNGSDSVVNGLITVQNGGALTTSSVGTNSGVIFRQYGASGTAVNHVFVQSVATGSAVMIGSEGSDAAVPIIVQPQGGAPTRFINTAYTQAVALTPGSTVAWNAGTSPNATLAPTASFTLSNPTGLLAGAWYTLTITQDATGSRLITWGTVFKFPGGVKFVLSTAANAIDTISCYSPDGTNLECSGLAAFS